MSMTGSIDSVMMRVIKDDLEDYLSWMQDGGLNPATQGFIEEMGWPNELPGTAYPEDAGKWNRAATYIMKQLERLGIGSLYFNTGATPRPTDKLSLYVSGDNNVLGAEGTIITKPASVFEAFCKPDRLMGVNIWPDMTSEAWNDWPGTIAGGGVYSNVNPGVADVDYLVLDADSIAWLASRGHTLIRLAIAWERVQPSLGGPLDTDHLNLIKGILSACADNGIGVDLSIFQGRDYRVGIDSNSYERQFMMYDTMPWSQVDASTICNLFDRLSQALSGHPGLFAYGLFNEPLLYGSGVITSGNLLVDFEDIDVGQPPNDTELLRCEAIVDDSRSFVGTKSIKIFSDDDANDATLRYTPFVATPGAQYLSMARGSCDPWGVATIQIWWYDENGAFIETDGSRTGAFIPLGNPPLQPGEWMYGTSVCTAPANAAEGRLTVRCWPLYGGRPLWVDDLQVYECSSVRSGRQGWFDLSQDIIDTIRANDTTAEIWLDKHIGMSGSSLWHDYCPDGPWATDPHNKLRYVHHLYFDHARSAGGGYQSSYADELAANTEQGY